MEVPLVPFVLFAVVRTVKSHYGDDTTTTYTVDVTQAHQDFNSWKDNPTHDEFGTYVEIQRITFDGTKSEGKVEVLETVDFDDEGEVIAPYVPPVQEDTRQDGFPEVGKTVKVKGSYFDEDHREKFFEGEEVTITSVDGDFFRATVRGKKKNYLSNVYFKMN